MHATSPAVRDRRMPPAGPGHVADAEARPAGVGGRPVLRRLAGDGLAGRAVTPAVARRTP